MRDGRGRHHNRGSHHGYAHDAFEHYQRVSEYGLGRPCLHSCPFDRRCGQNFTPVHLMRAHVQMHGTNTTKTEGDNGQALYACALTFSEVKQRRKELVMGAISFSATDTSQRVERFMVADVGPVCAEFCRVAHGVPIGTWNKLLADARAGRLQAGAEWDAAGEELEDADLQDEGSSTAKEETSTSLSGGRWTS